MDGFSHKEPQEAYENGCLDVWIKENMLKLKAYNKLDVLSLYSLTKSFRDSVMKICQSDIFDYLTIGGQAYDIFKKMVDKKLRKKVKSLPDEEMDLFVRKSLTAGRVEVMKDDGKPCHISG